nr:MAG TPA: hypothetical protein [Caudoviricetes sp.]
MVMKDKKTHLPSQGSAVNITLIMIVSNNITFCDYPSIFLHRKIGLCVSLILSK